MTETKLSPVDISVTHDPSGSAIMTIIHRDSATAIDMLLTPEERYQVADLILNANGSGMMRTHRPDKPVELTPTPPAIT